MKITAASISNFKRIQNVEIVPRADRAVVLIGGKNAQGKSSVLDALTAAFGGKRALPPDPVRHGANAAEVVLELDDGMTIRRRIEVDGSSTLEVRDAMGAVRSPQAMLDKLVGARFLDPLAFLALPGKEQRATLMKLIPGAERIDELNAKRLRAFDKRTEIGRDLTKAKGELARLPEVEIGTPLDVAALVAERTKLADVQRATDALAADYRAAEASATYMERAREELQKEVGQINDEIARLIRRREVLDDEMRSATDVVLQRRAEVKAAKEKLEAAAAEWKKLEPRLVELGQDLARADQHNRAVVEAETQMKRRAEAAEDVTKKTAEYDLCTEAISTIDKRKADILGGAKLPVDGLAVVDEGIELGGVPFAQASGAERLRVALALAIAAAPALNDVWIRDGALLDDDSLELVAKYAGEAGKRVWIERVGTSDPGVIVIQDGRVAAQEAHLGQGELPGVA